MRNTTSRIMRFIARRKAATIKSKKIVIAGRRHRCQSYISRKKNSTVLFNFNKEKKIAEPKIIF